MNFFIKETIGQGDAYPSKLQVYGTWKKLSNGSFLVKNYIEGSGIQFNLIKDKKKESAVLDEHGKQFGRQILQTQDEVDRWAAIWIEAL